MPKPIVGPCGGPDQPPCPPEPASFGALAGIIGGYLIPNEETIASLKHEFGPNADSFSLVEMAKAVQARRREALSKDQQ